MLNNITNFPDTMNININNKRAPTDESVRVFNEMREQASKSILASGRDDLRVGNLRWVLMDRPEYFGAELVFAIDVNGSEHEGILRLDRLRISASGSSPDAQCKKIEEMMLEAIQSVVTQAIRRDLIVQAAFQISKAVLL